MKMYLGGKWSDGKKRVDVINPYNHEVIDTVPSADEAEVQMAIDGAVEGARAMRDLDARQRYEILFKASQLIEEKTEDLAKTICLEEGKTIHEATFEVSRAVETMRISAEESKRIYGETLPMDSAPGGTGRLGFTLRVPCGVVVAIAPFNFPLNLVCHKVGPALAAGNAVIVKPASDTPLTALKLVEILLEAGLPEKAIACVTGSGGVLGNALCSDGRVRKITFTGSAPVGEKICQVAGMKRVTMELGSNCPLVVMDDADLEKAAEMTAATGFSNAGQVCISTQRVMTSRKISEEFLHLLQKKVEAIKTGDPMDPSTKMGPMIRETDTKWVRKVMENACNQGARIVTGGDADKNLMQPSIISNVHDKMEIFQEELFAPAVTVTEFDDVNAAIALSNNSAFGLGASIFTRDIGAAMKYIKEVESGNIHINWGPAWRADFMPYGGLKMSGTGKEGPRYAIKEMTEVKMVVIHPE